LTDPALWLLDPWVLNVLIGVATLHPLWRIFRRAGLSPWPSLFILVPILGFPAVGSFLAFQRWPKIPPRMRKGAR